MAEPESLPFKFPHLPQLRFEAALRGRPAAAAARRRWVGVAQLRQNARAHCNDPVTALALADIPSDINTFERLAFWVAQCLQNTSNGDEVNAVLGEGSVPVAQAAVQKTADGRDRAIIVMYLPINYAELNSSEYKTWMAAQEISMAAPAAVFLAN